MLTLIAILLFLILLILWNLSSQAREIILRFDADTRAKLQSQMDEERVRAETGDAESAIERIGADLKIIKRRMIYLPMMCHSLRQIEAYLEKRWDLDRNEVDPDVRLPTERLLRIRELEQEMPLAERGEEEKKLLEEIVRRWRESADRDEFEAALGRASDVRTR